MKRACCSLVAPFPESVADRAQTWAVDSWKPSHCIPATQHFSELEESGAESKKEERRRNFALVRVRQPFALLLGPALWRCCSPVDRHTHARTRELAHKSSRDGQIIQQLDSTRYVKRSS